MKFGIVAPTENIAIVSDHTEFDVALGYMAMRYGATYLPAILEQRARARSVALLQMPEYLIRDDYYFTAARRIAPLWISSTPYFTTQMQLETYITYLAAKERFDELKDSHIVPIVTSADHDGNLAVYAQTSRRHFVMWSAAIDFTNDKFMRSSIIVGMLPIADLKRLKPFGLVTAYPIFCARRGWSALDDDGELRPALGMDITPDWVNIPLTDDQIALAIENIKEIKSAVNDSE